MIRFIKPIDNKADFNKLVDSFFKFLDNHETFKFMSYSLIRFDKETIEDLTSKHKEHGIDYIVYEKDELFKGVLTIKRNPSQVLRLLIKNDFRPIDIQFHARADGMDLVKLRKYIN